jgi:hypothetical protein
MTVATTWRIQGDVMEACSCPTTCPCNFGSAPTQLPCHAILAWRVGDGQYGTTRLNGLHLVAYLLIPGNVFDGNWTMGVYLDQQASPQQAEALGAIFSGQAGGWPAAVSGLIGHPLAPKQVPIHFEAADGDLRISVPGLLEVGTERVPNPMPGQPPLEPTVSGLVVPFYKGTVNVRRSTRLKLTDPNLSFEYSARSSLIGQFDYSGP